MAHRIDFKHVREQADFLQILRALGVEPTKDGTKPGQYKALCPFHPDTNPSLKINVDRGIFHCFVCEAKGNVIDFVMQKEGLEIRAAAERIIEICGITPTANSGSGGTDRAKRSAPPAAKESISTDEALPTTNRELSFSLQLERDDELLTWLEARGIDHDAIEGFGLGRASSKSKTIGNRLAIPIHNADGQLVAYCGRHVGNDAPKDVPKYVLPKGFRKELEVFNLHRVTAERPTKGVVIVESYLSVMRHHPHLPIVSLMGRSISPQQIELIQGRGFRRAVIVGDGDQPGRDGARQIAGALATAMWTRVVELEDGVKPHHLAPPEFEGLLTRALRSG